MASPSLLQRFTQEAGGAYVDEAGVAVDVEFIDVVDVADVDAVVAVAEFEAALGEPFAKVLRYGAVDDDNFAIVSVATADASAVCRAHRPPVGVAVRLAQQCLWGANVLEDARAAGGPSPRLGLALVAEAGVTTRGIVLRRPLARPPQRARLRPKLHLLSPEAVRRGRDVGPASHQFTIASVLAEWISGQRTFVGDSEFAILEMMRFATPHPPLRDRIDDDALFDVVARMFAADPADRFGSCGEASAALQPFAADDDAVARFLAPHVGGPAGA